MSYQIKLYQLSNGKEPFKIWLEKLKDKTIKRKVRARILRIQEDGNFGDFKCLEKNLFELKFSDGIRIYYTKVGGEIILLLCAGNKSKQSDDIEKAKKYLKDYYEND